MRHGEGAVPGSARRTGAGAPRTGRYWAIAAGCFIIMVGASILLSGLSLFTAPIISDLYYAKDAAGEVITQSVGGRDLPVEVNGGQGAFLIYFTIMTSCIVIALMFFAGQLLSKLGARRTINIGGIVMAAGLALFATSQGNLMFYAAGALMGLGYGMSIALIPPALINNWFQAKRGLVLGIVLSGTGIGGLVWAGIGPSLA